MKTKDIPLLDCPVDYLFGDASGKVMNLYGRFPCKIKCGVYAMLVRGTARATINITQYTFKANDALVLEAGSFFLIHECSDDALVYYLLFSSSFIEKHTFGSRLPVSTIQTHAPIIHIAEAHAEVYKKLYSAMLDAANSQPSMLNSEVMIHVFNMLRAGYERYVKQESEAMVHPQERKMQIFQEYSQLVLKHYQEWHQVAQYASYMRLSVPHLCSTIKSASLRTAGEIISDAIMTDAKAQLKLTSLPIKEIAQVLGFDDVALFNRFFKAQLGITPRAYRNNEN